MFSFIKTAALSTVIAAGAITAVPATAAAEGLYLGFGDHHDRARVGIYLGDGGHADYRRHHGWDRPSCSPNRALNKAERLGLRRARVVDVDRRTITVRGRQHGDRVTVTFGRAPNCPIVRW